MEYRFTLQTLDNLAKEDDGKTHLSKLAGDAAAARRLTIELKRHLDKLQNDYADSMRINFALKGEVEIMDQSYKQVIDEAAGLAVDLMKAEQIAASYEHRGRKQAAKRLSATRAKLKAAQANVLAIAAANATLATSLRTKLDDRPASTAELDRANNLLKGCRTLINKQQTDFVTAKEQYGKLEENYNDAAKWLSKANRDLATCHRNYAELREATLQLRKQSDDKTRQMAKLNDNLHRSRSTRDAMQEELLALAKDRDEHMEVRRALEPHVSDLGAVAAQGNAFRKFLRELKDQLDGMDI